ncbi:MAG TPA: FecR domain-containing protein [Chthoniobacterales bacterium]|nr:FecR domain-containing protein [Chthoniobacterales bacterium]
MLPILASLSAGVVDGAGLRDGHISYAVHDVRIEADGHSVVAPKNAQLPDGFIRTGRDSRAEIGFSDKSVVRLGDNTVVKIDSNSRTFDLESGAILTQVPSRVGGTFVKVRDVTATATGATLAVECLPNAYIKFISLDGTSRLCVKKGLLPSDCVLLRAGHMIIANPDPKMLPESVDVDLNRLLQTSQFITQFPPLAGRDRLVKAAAVQRDKKAHGSFADTNLVIFGRGTLVSRDGTPAQTQNSSKPGRSPHQKAAPSQ